VFAKVAACLGLCGGLRCHLRKHVVRSSFFFFLCQNTEGYNYCNSFLKIRYTLFKTIRKTKENSASKKNDTIFMALFIFIERPSIKPKSIIKIAIKETTIANEILAVTSFTIICLISADSCFLAMSNNITRALNNKPTKIERLPTIVSIESLLMSNPQQNNIKEITRGNTTNEK
jgi:hypothetical protein